MIDDFITALKLDFSTEIKSAERAWDNFLAVSVTFISPSVPSLDIHFYELFSHPYDRITIKVRRHINMHGCATGKALAKRRQ